MQEIEQFLLKVVSVFMTTWWAAVILGIVILLAAIKKPKELFKVSALIVLLVGVLYIMIYLEQSTFSGVSSKQRSLEVKRQVQ